MNVATLFKKPGRTYARRPAIRHAGKEMSYGELDALTDSLAVGLRDLGLSPQDRIVLWMHNRPELVELLIAGWKANLTVVPVNVRLHPREVAFIAANCQARALAYDGDFVRAVRSIRDDLPAGLACIQVDGPALGAKSFEEILGSGPGTVEEAAEDDVAWLFYTSGTTGKPKGAMLTHRNLIAMVMNCLADVCSFQPEDVVLHVAPLTHGSGMFLLPALARGSLNVISHHASFEPAQVFELIAAQQVSVIAFLAPTMIAKLVNDPAMSRHDTSSLRCAPYGGGPMYVEQIKNAIEGLGPIWVQIYGQGETPMTATYLRSQEHRFDTDEFEQRLASAGITRTGMELRILDSDGGELATGRLGEIAVKGPTVMKGYWEDPPATAAALRNGWLHTGDIGYMDADGYVYIVDRAKDMIISGGNNVYPREVEEVLVTHPDILEAAVVGVPDPYWGESVHAVIATRSGAAMTVRDVIEHCRASLASYKKPRSVEFVRELPKSAYGKVLKREIRQKYWAGHDRQVGGGLSTTARRSE
jgi:acyl-CoA synthetase (AMP-forming)/AMP-acid ligase II